MKRILKITAAITLWTAYSSCGPQERVSKEVFEEVNQNMEVKKLSEAEILNQAMVWGDSVSTVAQKELVFKLQQAIAELGVPGAIDFCNVNALSILQKVGNDYQVSIRRASHRYRNPADQPTEEEQAILEAYEFNAESGLKSEPNIQKLQNGDVLLYTKPIVIPSGLCLSCHGNPGKEINVETQQKIDQLYPEDKAKGHQVGDLRGMWALRIPKSEIVKRM